MTPKTKIGLIGTGMVGSSFAYSLIQRGTADELVLIDTNTARAEGEAMDLAHGLSFVKPTNVYAGNYSDLKDAAVIVITAGLAQKPGESRMELVEKNAGIFKQIISEVIKYNTEGVILIATNPVDVLTRYTIDLSGFPANRVIGSGTVLDTARFRHLLGKYYDVDARSISAYIVGEHGDSELPAWSRANIAGIPLLEYVSCAGKKYEKEAFDSIFEQTRDAAYTIIEKKGATYYAIGLGLLEVVEAIVRNQRTILTVSSLMKGQHGVNDICISLPTIVGRNGIEEVLDIPLSDEEVDLFRKSADTLQERYNHIK